MTTLAFTFSSRMYVPTDRHIHRHGGYSLMEIGMVLAIVALLIAGVLLFVSNANDGARSADTVRKVLAIEGAVYQAYRGQSSYDGLSAAVLVGGKQLPTRWISGGGLVDPYGGATLVYADPVNAGWDVVLYGLSSKACQEAALAGQQMGSNLVQIVVNPGTAGSSTVPSTGGVGSYGLSQAAWMAAVVNACSAGSSIRFSMAS